MILDLLKNRRSIRQYENRPVEEEKIGQLIEAALRSPSSRSLNPWEFVVITDRDTIRRVSQAKQHGSAFLAQAPLVIAVIADPDKCDVWVEDCSIAAIIVQLTAEDLGLSSCWAQIRLRSHADGHSSEDYVKEVLDLPQNYVVEALIGIGYPAEFKAGHTRESLGWEKVHTNRYQKGQGS